MVGYWRCYDPPLWALKERAAVRTGRIWCSNRIYPPCTQNGASSCHSLPRNNNIAAQLIKACRWGSNCCTWVHDRAATLNEGRSVANLTCLWAPHIERVRLYVSGVQRTQLVTWQVFHEGLYVRAGCKRGGVQVAKDTKLDRVYVTRSSSPDPF